MERKTTLKELARILNVSISTVSKALNDISEINPDTKARIKEVALLELIILHSPWCLSKGKVIPRERLYFQSSIHMNVTTCSSGCFSN